VKPAFYFGRIGTFQKQLDRFLQIRGSGFNCVPLAGDVELRAERDISRPFFLYDRRIASGCHVSPYFLSPYLSGPHYSQSFAQCLAKVQNDDEDIALKWPRPFGELHCAARVTPQQ
jgi:hypothetical protein